MSRSRQEMVVGFVFLAGFLGLLYYSIMISGFRLGATKRYLVNFPQVYGLKKGDAVRVEGKEAGEVKSLKLLEKGRVRAVLVVSEDVTIYRHGSSVRVTPFSPLGGRIVEIKRGSASERGEYRFYDHPDGVSMDKADVIEGEAEGELLQTLNGLVEDNRGAVKRIVDNLDHVSKKLTEEDAGVLGYLINSESGASKLESVATRMSSAADRVDRILERAERGEGVVGGLLKEGSPLQRDIEGAAEGISESSKSLSSILARADAGDSALGVLVTDESHGGVTDSMRGIVTDVKAISGEVASGRGTLGKLVHDDRLYEGAAGTTENLASITRRIDDGDGLLGVLLEDEAGDNARDSLQHLASITAAIDDPESGTLGLLVHDDVLRGRISRIAEEIERLVVEFRDSTEDLREQAPVNAFIGAVFSAF